MGKVSFSCPSIIFKFHKIQLHKTVRSTRSVPKVLHLYRNYFLVEVTFVVNIINQQKRTRLYSRSSRNSIQYLCKITIYIYIYVVCFLLGDSPASDLYMPTFRNTLSVPSSKAGVKSHFTVTVNKVQMKVMMTMKH